MQRGSVQLVRYFDNWKRVKISLRKVSGICIKARINTEDEIIKPSTGNWEEETKYKYFSHYPAVTPTYSVQAKSFVPSPLRHRRLHLHNQSTDDGRSHSLDTFPYPCPDRCRHSPAAWFYSVDRVLYLFLCICPSQQARAHRTTSSHTQSRDIPDIKWMNTWIHKIEMKAQVPLSMVIMWRKRSL